jgi:hypothetical protein
VSTPSSNWAYHTHEDAVEKEEDMTAVIAFLLLVVMFVIGSRVHGVRHSFWKFLAFVTACIVVLALVLAFLAR